MSDDARIPVVVQSDPAWPLAPGDCRLALPAGAGPHGGPHLGTDFACACCRPRGVLGQALALLYVRQMRGERDACRRVVVSSNDAGAVRHAIEADVLANARFRFAGELAIGRPT